MTATNGRDAGNAGEKQPFVLTNSIDIYEKGTANLNKKVKFLEFGNEVSMDLR